MSDRSPTNPDRPVELVGGRMLTGSHMPYTPRVRAPGAVSSLPPLRGIMPPTTEWAGRCVNSPGPDAYVGGIVAELTLSPYPETSPGARR